MRPKMAEEEGLLLFSKCPIDKGTSLLHSVLDGLCGRNGPQYQSYQTIWQLEEWWQLIEACSALFNQAVREKWEKQKMMSNIEHLSSGHQQHILDAYSARQEELKQHFAQVGSAVSNAVLTDFDWQLKLVMSSDKLASVQQPLLSLDLGVTTESGSVVKSIEMTKQDLENMISSLEAANKAVIQLKT